MARVVERTPARRVVLDASALIGLTRGHDDTRALLDAATHHHYPILVPTPVLAQVHRGGRDRARLDRVLKIAMRFVPTSEAVARHAGELLGRSGTEDAIDAIVVAEAFDNAPSVIVTSDAHDMTVLTQADPECARVVVFGI